MRAFYLATLLILLTVSAFADPIVYGSGNDDDNKTVQDLRNAI